MRCICNKMGLPIMGYYRSMKSNLPACRRLLRIYTEAKEEEGDLFVAEPNGTKLITLQRAYNILKVQMTAPQKATFALVAAKLGQAS